MTGERIGERVQLGERGIVRQAGTADEIEREGVMTGKIEKGVEGTEIGVEVQEERGVEGIGMTMMIIGKVENVQVMNFQFLDFFRNIFIFFMTIVSTDPQNVNIVTDPEADLHQ